jgi:stalled ribosome rescue protein Dom34
MVPKGYRRGYAVAVLVGLGENQAAVWKVFSHVVKPERNISLNGSRSDAKALYNFHEAIVNALRPTLKEGVKSIIIAAPTRTDYTAEFQKHVRSHHSWLTQGPGKAALAEIVGPSVTAHEITVLTRTPQFRLIIGETTLEETENLLELLEKRLNAPGEEPLVLYSLEEIENAIYGSAANDKPQPEYLVLVDTYLSGSRQKGRLHRLQQIAKNRGIQTKIVKSDSPAGKRVIQLGGIICLLKKP